MSTRPIQNVIDAIDALVQEEAAPVRFSPSTTLSDSEIEDFITESLRQGPTCDFSRPVAQDRNGNQDTCVECGGPFHGTERNGCLGATPYDPDDEHDAPTDFYTVAFEIDVDTTLARTPREAALIALRLFMQGEVGCTVTDTEHEEHEVTITAPAPAPRESAARRAIGQMPEPRTVRDPEVTDPPSIRRQRVTVPAPAVGNRRTRWMELRYRGFCQCCGSELPRGTLAHYNAETRKVTCKKVACTRAAGIPRPPRQR